MNTISVLGCGWLGLPLAETLLKAGYQVKGSTRTKSDLTKLEEKGITSFLLELNPEIRGDGLDSFFDSNILIIDFPPERRHDIVTYHELQAVSLIDRIKASPIDRVIFVSSTSVYPDLNREVTETDAQEPTKKGTVVLRLLMEEQSF